jgi:hypothetical protein
MLFAVSVLFSRMAEKGYREPFLATSRKRPWLWYSFIGYGALILYSQYGSFEEYGANGPAKALVLSTFSMMIYYGFADVSRTIHKTEREIAASTV